MFHTMQELIHFVGNSEKKRMAVVCAADSHALQAVKMAVDNDMVFPILIGEEQAVKAVIEEIGGLQGEYSIIDIADPDEAAAKAVDMVKNEEADFIMKGQINSSNLLRPVVKKDGLNVGNVISHLTIMEVPGYHKLFGLTDCAMNIQPNLEQKVSITMNAVRAFNRMGYDNPKVALLCANEEVNPKQPDTVDAREIQNRNESGELQNCIISGPIAFDIAMDAEAAAVKKFDSPVAGDADILVVPNIVTGNVLNKALKQFGNNIACGTVIGAKCPIALSSRTTPIYNKFLTIVFSASMA